MVMGTSFDQALAFILKFEGGYSNHPSDTGGETNKGVTALVYNAYRTRLSLPVRSVKLIEDDEVAAIYIKGYWNPCKCNMLPSPLNLLVFDMAVNSGTLKAIKTLQGCLSVEVDGIIGAHTLQAIKDSDLSDLCERLLDARDDFYMNIIKARPSQSVFLKGWLSRTNQLRTLIQ